MRTRVAVLTTGGTIDQLSAPDGRSAPGFDPRRLVSSLGLDDVGLTFTRILDKGSKDIGPADWQAIAGATHRALGSGVDGVVLLHGTDTMHYTAAALSFMLGGLPAPVVLTGSMVPGGDEGSDAAANLRDAVLVAARADLGEVCVVFSADARRSSGLIIRGCRARKLHSSAIDAFASINAAPLGRVRDDHVELRAGVRRRRTDGTLALATGLAGDVALIKLTPALSPQRLQTMLAGTAGAVLEGTGVGHLRGDHHEVVAAYGRPTVMSTQAIHGGERLGSYASDALTVALPNLIPGDGMTSETALVKLMWCLARQQDVHGLMATDLAGELRE